MAHPVDGQRGGQTRLFVAHSEAEGVSLDAEHMDRMATMSADEASHWNLLHAGWGVDRINHSAAHSDHGKHTNLVESFFSRLRGMTRGQYHFVSPQHLHQHANHAAWLENNRRLDNGTAARKVVASAMGSPVGRTWAGYW